MIEDLSISLLLDAPYWGYLLSSLPKVSEEQIPFVALSVRNDRICLLVQPSLKWASIAEKDRYLRLLQHELLHLLFQHFLDRKAYPDPMLFDLAGDIQVNQYIRSIPESEGVQLHHIQQDWEPFQSLDYYYQRLRMLPKDRLETLYQQNDYLWEAHRWWGREEVAEDLVRTDVDALCQTTLLRLPAVNQEDLHASLLRRIRPEKRKLEVSWQQLLRQFAGASGKSLVRYSMKRPSKRYGTVPGLKIKRQHRLIIAIDTSGSVPTADLEVIGTELYFLWKTGVQFTILEFDQHIQRSYSFKGRLPDQFSGGGGTDFSEVLEFANQQRDCDGLIIFTDGYGPTPLNVCRVPILWLISRRGLDRDSGLFQQLPGRKQKLQNG
jgi:predicted metal-dependent peptidase